VERPARPVQWRGLLVDEVGQGMWRGHRCGEGLAHGKVVVGGAHQKGGGEMVAAMTILGEATTLPRPAADERQRRSGVALTP
jgi:hypothetical protein